MLHLNRFYDEQAVSRLRKSAEIYCSSLSAWTASLKNTSNNPRFSDLPISVQLHIFSYLDVCSLCRLAQTCRTLNRNSSDSLLWSHLLTRDCKRWTVLGHLSYPPMYTMAHSDLTPKQIYQACYCNREAMLQHSFSYPLTNKLWSLLRRLQGHVPRLLVFGSGLETLPFIRALMWEEQSPYKPIGMSPGKDGVGSGVCVQHRDKAINLVTLYRAPKAERVNGNVNKLLSSLQGGLAPAIQDQCQQANGLMLVVHCTEPAAEDVAMLCSMLAHCPSHTPVLVLSCQYTAQDKATMPVTWAHTLHLEQLSHPWQIRALSLDLYTGLLEGVDWLLSAGQ